jgi:hypothetical protein
VRAAVAAAPSAVTAPAAAVPVAARCCLMSPLGGSCPASRLPRLAGLAVGCCLGRCRRSPPDDGDRPLRLAPGGAPGTEDIECTSGANGGSCAERVHRHKAGGAAGLCLGLLGAELSHLRQRWARDGESGIELSASSATGGTHRKQLQGGCIAASSGNPGNTQAAARGMLHCQPTLSLLLPSPSGPGKLDSRCSCAARLAVGAPEGCSRLGGALATECSWSWPAGGWDAGRGTRWGSGHQQGAERGVGMEAGRQHTPLMGALEMAAPVGQGMQQAHLMGPPGGAAPQRAACQRRQGGGREGCSCRQPPPSRQRKRPRRERQRMAGSEGRWHTGQGMVHRRQKRPAKAGWAQPQLRCCLTHNAAQTSVALFLLLGCRAQAGLGQIAGIQQAAGARRQPAQASAPDAAAAALVATSAARPAMPAAAMPAARSANHGSQWPAAAKLLVPGAAASRSSASSADDSAAAAAVAVSIGCDSSTFPG